MSKLVRFFIAAAALTTFFFAFSQRGIERQIGGRFFAAPQLRPGGTIGDMVITNGVQNAIPLWAFCLSAKEDDRSIRVDCEELPSASLAVGHTFGVMDLIPESADWEDLTWEMSVDGHTIDLDAFGVYDLGYPALASRPSSIREVFMRLRLWDVVLANITPGMHRLQGQALPPDGEAYRWVVHFSVREDL
jgi:hypothetical protein